MRARVLWWLMVRAERASGWLRVQVIAIWRRGIEKRQRKRTPVVRWEAWYMEDLACQRCGVIDDRARELGACRACGYEGKEISSG